MGKLEKGIEEYRVAEIITKAKGSLEQVRSVVLLSLGSPETPRPLREALLAYINSDTGEVDLQGSFRVPAKYVINQSSISTKKLKFPGWLGFLNFRCFSVKRGSEAVMTSMTLVQCDPENTSRNSAA